MMRTYAAAGAAVWLLVVGAAAWGQERGTDLDSFYGKRSFQTIAVGVAPYVAPEGGVAGELSFGFNTLSRRSQPAHWLNYYGVSLDVGGVQNEAYPSDYWGDADLDLWYGALLIESRLFYTDQGPVRPYVGLRGGFGFGGFTIADEERERSTTAGQLNLYRLGVEAGVHVRLSERACLVISDTTSAYYGTIEKDDVAIFPSTVFVGISLWRGLGDME